MKTTKPMVEDPEFSALPLAVRNEVENWAILLSTIRDARPLRKLILQLAVRRKVSIATVYHKLERFERHGWQGLINRAKYPTPVPATAPSHAFRQFLHGLWLTNKKNFKVTHEQILAMWKGGARIPGYNKANKGGPPPREWNYANFNYHIKTTHERFLEDSTISKVSP